MSFLHKTATQFKLIDENALKDSYVQFACEIEIRKRKIEIK